MRLEKSKIIISTHVYTTGPAQDLRDFLIEKKAGEVMFIGHPIFYDEKLDGSGFERYISGAEVKRKYQKISRKPEIIEYILHSLKTIHWILRTKKKWDLFVGSDNLNAFSGIILKKIGRVKRVVYYVIDYNPYRFQNKALNWFYHKIDQFCVRGADVTWNLSQRMIDARKKYYDFSGGNQIVVPIGIWFDRVEPKKNASKFRKLAFMGHVVKKQGVQYVLEALPTIAKKIPNFKLEVIGGGDYLETLKDLADKLNVKKNVKFHGYIESHETVEKLLSECDVALAIYEKFDEYGNLSFTYFADPGKLKSYLAAGLPVVLTDVPHTAKDIERCNCGKIVDTDPASIAKAVINLMADSGKLREFKKNAREYARKFDWIKIFEENLNSVLE